MELNLPSFWEPDVLRETSIMDETPLHHESTSENDTAMAAFELVEDSSIRGRHKLFDRKTLSMQNLMPYADV